MVRPSPNPPKRRVVEVTPCSRTSKMRGKTSGAIPMPVSLTSINRSGMRGCESSLRSSLRERTVSCPPAGVNLIAFLIRFQRACWNRIGSASIWCRLSEQVDVELKLGDLRDRRGRYR